MAEIVSSSGGDTKYQAAAIFAVTEVNEGEYKVDQVEAQDRIPKSPNAGGSVFPFGPVSLGPVSAQGQVDISTLDIQVEVKVLGFTIGSFRGNLKDGISISINLAVVNGKLRFYLKGKDVWLQISLKSFFKDFNFDQKLFGLPN